MFKLLYNHIYGLFSQFMEIHIFGMTAGCTGEVGFPIANQVGILMIVSTLLTFVIFYYFIDSVKYNRKKHWWLSAFILMIINGLIAGLFVWSDFYDGNFCSQNPISGGDVFGFAFLNAIWAWLFYTIITSVPFLRHLVSKNCSNTTFWKP